MGVGEGTSDGREEPETRKSDWRGRKIDGRGNGRKKKKQRSRRTVVLFTRLVMLDKSKEVPSMFAGATVAAYKR